MQYIGFSADLRKRRKCQRTSRKELWISSCTVLTQDGDWRILLKRKVLQKTHQNPDHLSPPPPDPPSITSPEEPASDLQSHSHFCSHFKAQLQPLFRCLILGLSCWRPFEEGTEIFLLNYFYDIFYLLLPNSLAPLELHCYWTSSDHHEMLQKDSTTMQEVLLFFSISPFTTGQGNPNGQSVSELTFVCLGLITSGKNSLWRFVSVQTQYVSCSVSKTGMKGHQSSGRKQVPQNVTSRNTS